MSSRTPDPITIIGAGLAGSLLAVLLARRGLPVTVFERFPDQRRTTIPAGRSINLALASRGRAALERAGLLSEVDRFCLPMAGRMLHEPGESPRLQRYGQREHEVIYSVHRARLNAFLLDAAEQAGARLVFDRRLSSVDFEHQRCRFEDEQGGHHEHEFGVVIGADGAGSALRRAMAEVTDLGAREDLLDHGYKEFSIPPGEHGFQLEAKALHIWPRGGFMMIALPNPDRSFTCTLFLAHDGDPGFDQLTVPEKQQAFMREQFPDAGALMPDMLAEFRDNPVGRLGTLRCRRWRLGSRAVLLGDAAHAIVPFHGQGMNAAFEDVAALDALIADHAGDWETVFSEFEAQRKPNADAIADMALENYEEMRSAVRDPRFHLKKSLEWALERELPDRFIPRYSMIMFHTLPYAEAQRRGRIQAELLAQLTAGRAVLEEIDLQQAATAVRERLPPL